MLGIVGPALHEDFFAEDFLGVGAGCFVHWNVKIIMIVKSKRNTASSPSHFVPSDRNLYKRTLDRVFFSDKEDVMSKEVIQFRFARLKYPVKARPTASVGGLIFYIYDISQSGMKLIGPIQELTIFKQFFFTLHFDTQESVLIKVEVIRKVGDMIGVHFSGKLKKKVLEHEYKYLKATFGSADIRS